ncbi:MAG: outer membrane lipoprotein carrier protein LolA [Deltaproteobacteria bacterium]|jgi:outer membrane lipoprotein-sorting protein|nr:outer membrane lipoprotein carrier protein LolA [Deltaproteobacteria bacterium]MCL5879615.1 outer membrane lipoprotein carrier protein LolA [Deltaproteobacteria bacterium]MDA8305030.1 outer membrane lipoprotein carrier protein LolA [Deltaproteobacteria bacterium]
MKKKLSFPRRRESITAKLTKLPVLFLILPVLFLIGFIPKSYGKEGNNNIIGKIEAKYKTVHSISAYFVQKEIIPGYSQNMSFKGNFYYKEPGNMAWVYTYPMHKRQVLKGNELYIIDSDIKKVTVINVGKERGGFPPNIVAVIGSLTKYFSVESVKKDAVKGIVGVGLKPLSLQRAKEIYIDFAINSLKITSLKILTYQGQTIIFHYAGVRFNRHINSHIFSVNFPASYKIIKEN